MYDVSLVHKYFCSFILVLVDSCAVRQLKHFMTCCYGEIIISRVVKVTLLHHALKCFLLYLLHNGIFSSVLINILPDVLFPDICCYVPICLHFWFASLFNLNSSNAQLCIIMLSVQPCCSV